MKKAIPLLLILALVSSFSFAQKIDSLKLTSIEVPKEYVHTDKDLGKSIQAILLYKNPEMYAMLLGNVVEKGYQSFDKKGDSGTIYYLIFDQEVDGRGFIKGLLWGTANKPTKAHPEEYIAKGNTLIILSLEKDSPLKKLSKEKIAKLL